MVYVRGRCREETIYCVLNELWRLNESTPAYTRKVIELRPRTYKRESERERTDAENRSRRGFEEGISVLKREAISIKRNCILLNFFGRLTDGGFKCQKIRIPNIRNHGEQNI